MVEIRTVIVCIECRISWAPDGAPTCADGAHTHRPFEVHRHRTDVVLPDGTTVVAVSFDAEDPYGRDVGAEPAFGLYLDARWASPPWPSSAVDWPDFGLPADVDAFRSSLADVLARARAGERIELGCLGAHGRTGSALACLAVLCGHPADDAVDWIRRTYCPKAVETDDQAAFVASFTA